MKTTITRLTLALALTTALSAPALAGCGSDHAKAERVDAQPSIYEVAEAAGFTTLVTAIDATNLEGTLDGSGPFTVFAPTDEAFAKLPEGVLASLLEDPDALKEILLYHAVSGRVTAAQVVDLKSAKTVNGGELSIAVGDVVMINDATVIQADVMAENGVIHVIDTVLIP